MKTSLLPHTKLSRFIEEPMISIGKLLSWIWLALMATIFLNVVLRYGFSEGRIELEELQWHLYSIGFLFGLSYTFLEDKHIRVDVLHEKFSPNLQAWIELYGLLLFLMPFLLLIIIFSVPFVASSYELSEISPSPGGLPFRWIIKSSLLIGFLMLFIATLSRISRIWSFLFLDSNNAR